jgi:hypothetical protein
LDAESVSRSEKWFANKKTSPTTGIETACVNSEPNHTR